MLSFIDVDAKPLNISQVKHRDRKKDMDEKKSIELKKMPCYFGFSLIYLKSSVESRKR